MLLDDKQADESVRLVSGQVYEARIDVHDPNGDAIDFRWELKPETTATSGGGDYEAPLAGLEGFLSAPNAAKTSLMTPEPGKYRLFAYATDEQGRVGHANIPFLVEGGRENR